jgi:3-deoxy-7-phosphoheptulonate synthase
VQVAVDAVRAAAARHAFAGIDADGRSAILHTRGNRDCHIILRGGGSGTNYDAESVEAATAMLRASNLPERLMIDLSHDNSSKDPSRQPAVAEAVGLQVAAGNKAITGVMLESFLVEGNQAPGPLDTGSRSPTAASAGRRRSTCWTDWLRRRGRDASGQLELNARTGCESLS